MTVWMGVAVVWGGATIGIGGWWLYTWRQLRQAERRTRLTLVRRFQEQETRDLTSR